MHLVSPDGGTEIAVERFRNYYRQGHDEQDYLDELPHRATGGHGSAQLQRDRITGAPGPAGGEAPRRIDYAATQQGVLGGATLVLFGLLALVGVRIWLGSGVAFADPVNLAVLGTAIIAGVGDLTLSVGDLRVTGVVWGSVGIVLLYPMLRRLADVRSGRQGWQRGQW